MIEKRSTSIGIPCDEDKKIVWAIEITGSDCQLELIDKAIWEAYHAVIVGQSNPNEPHGQTPCGCGQKKD